MDQAASELQGEPIEEDVSRILSDRGWRLGTIFRAPHITIPCIGRSKTGRRGELVPTQYEVPGDGIFVVATQSCDISAAVAVEPFIEAFPCDLEPDGAKRANFRKSFRRFEIDPVTGLMANAAYRVPFYKEALLDITPEQWPGDDRRLRTFSDWIGRRSSRTALPDPLVEAFVRPLGDVLRNLKKRDPVVYRRFMDAVAQIRLVPPDEEIPPYDIKLILLQESNMLTTEQAEAIETVIGALTTALDPAKAVLALVKNTSWTRMSTEEYLYGSVFVEVEYLSYNGLELVGSNPFPLP